MLAFGCKFLLSGIANLKIMTPQGKATPTMGYLFIWRHLMSYRSKQLRVCTNVLLLSL